MLVAEDRRSASCLRRPDQGLAAGGISRGDCWPRRQDREFVVEGIRRGPWLELVQQAFSLKGFLLGLSFGSRLCRTGLLVMKFVEEALEDTVVVVRWERKRDIDRNQSSYLCSRYP